MFRVERGLLFVDDSGQFRCPHSGEPNETSVLAGILIPNTDEDRSLLVTLASSARARGFRKARDFDDAAYLALARALRERWVPAVQGLSADAGTRDALSDLPVRALQFVRDARRKLGGGKSMDLRLDFLELQLAGVPPPQVLYLGTLLSLYTRVAEWFVARGIAPHLQVQIDEKLPFASRELHDFWLRFAVCGFYPGIYRDRLAGILGADPMPELVCGVGSDESSDGLFLTDALAFAWGSAVRGQDATGRFGRILAEMGIQT